MSDTETVTVPAEEFRMLVWAAAGYCQSFTMADYMQLEQRIALRKVEEIVARHGGFGAR